MDATLSNHLLKYRHIYGVLSIIFCFFSGTGLLSVTFDADPSRYFSGDSPHFKTLRQMQNDYGQTSSITFVVKVKNGELFTRENLAVVEKLTQQALQLPLAQRVDSLSNYTYTWSSNDELYVDDLIQNAQELSDDEIDKIKHFALNDAATKNRLASTEGEVALVNLVVDIPEEERIQKELYLSKMAQELAAEFESKYPQIDILITGKVFTNATVNNTVYKDCITLIPLSALIIFSLLSILLQSIWAVIIIAIITFSSIVTAIGLASLSGIILTLLSITSINIIMTVAIAHCVHIIVFFLQAYRSGKNKKESLFESYRINLQPVFITSFTTILGFLSMNFSTMPPAHDLGNITALGVFFALVFSLTLLPILIMIFPISKKKSAYASTLPSNMNHFAAFIINHHKVILFLTLIFSIIMTIFSLQNSISDNYAKNLKKPAKVRIDNEEVDKYFGGIHSIEYSLEAEDGQSISNIEYLKYLDEFTQWLRLQPEVRNVFSYADIIKRLNQNMHNDDPTYYRIPDTTEEAAQYLLLFEVSGQSNTAMNHLIKADKSATRLIVALPTVDSTKIIELRDRFENRINHNLPGYMHHTGTSLSVIWAYLTGEVVISSVKGALFALFLISMILVLIFKSLRFGTISLIPNLFPMGIGYGIWYLYNGFLDTSQMMVLSITIGIVVDDTVHFLTKYLRARQQLDYSPEEAIHYTFKYVGAPLWITTFVLVSGFLTLIFSSFVPNSNLGALTAIILMAALALDFLLLPTLLLQLDKKQYIPALSRKKSNI